MDRRRAAGALLALAACIACSAAAPTASNQTALDLYEGAPEGCYYNFQHYGEGDRIMTNEPCLNCTCHNRMLMCYLRVCPFTKAIGQDCTVEKRADQCCPIVTCPDVPVDLLTSTSTTSPAEYGATGLGKPDKYGCSINGKYFSEGSKVPPTPNKPCEHCYCIRNMTTCVMQECTLHVDGCTPIYHKDVCCPVRYSCDHPEDEVPLLDDMSTTVRPTPGFLLTTTTVAPVTQMTQDCVHDDKIFADGALIKTEKACEHCYCMKGDIVCVVQECGAPMENEGKNCTSLPPREGQCCPDTYICEGDELSSDLPLEPTTELFIEKLTTLSPPRRAGVEGSGYRNEPDETYTEIPTIESELEGSGEEQDTSKPLQPEEIPITEDEDNQYISVITKAPTFEHQQTTEINRDIIPDENIEEETVEPQVYLPTTNAPVEEVEKLTTSGVIEEENFKPHEHVPTNAPEGYEKTTTESSELLNTVPDELPEEGIAHEYVPTTTSIPKGGESESPSLEGQKDEKLSEKEPAVTVSALPVTSKPEYNSPSYTTSDEIGKSTDSPDEVPNVTTEVTEKEYFETDSGITGTTSAIATEESENPAPQENESYKPEPLVPSTTSSSVEEDGKLTTQPDHAQNTVAIAEEETTQPHSHIPTATIGLPSVEEETTTVSNLEQNMVTDKVIKDDVYVPHDDVSTAVPPLIENVFTTSEPDKGLNTIPSEINEESSSEASVPEITTLIVETKATESSIITEEQQKQDVDIKPTTVSETLTSLPESIITKGDQYTITTEPSFRKEDESSVSTEKPKEFEPTTVKAEFVEEDLIPTSPLDERFETSPDVPSIEEDLTTSVPEYTKDIEETIGLKQTTESILETSVMTESLPGKVPEHSSEKESELPSSTEKTSDITAFVPEDVENHEVPSRIPGEGDCLLNGVTYRNNTVVPSTNNCHTGCRCASSIIKCDPIICSPPPDYMDNCQSIYDSPDSCCPTYVCDHPKETVPPQSDNQMSGTESPMGSPTIECRGDQCEITEPSQPPVGPSDTCTSGSCSAEAVQKPEIQCGPEGCGPSKVHGEECTDGKCKPASCANGDCQLPQTQGQVSPIKPCEGEHCEKVDGVLSPPQLCQNEEDCKALETPVIQAIPCEGESCKKIDCGDSGCDFNAIASPQDAQQVPCNEEGGCKPHDCTGDEPCRRKEVSTADEKPLTECEGSDCKYETETTVIQDFKATESPTPDQTPTKVVSEEVATTDAEKATEIPEADISKPEDMVTVSITDTDTYTTEGQSDTKIPEKDDKKPAIFDEENKEKPTVVLEEGTEKPIMTEREGTEYPTDIDEKETEKPAVIYEEGKEKPDIVEREKTEEPVAVGEEGTDKPSLLEDAGEKKPTLVKEEGIDKPIVIDEEGTEIPSVYEEAETEKPVFIPGIETEKPVVVGDEAEEKPVVIEENVTTKPEISEEEGTEQPTLIDGEVKDKPSFLEEVDTDKPALTEKEGTEQPVIIQEEGTEKPSLIGEDIDKKQATERPSLIDGEGKEKPAILEEVDTDKPIFVKEDMEEPAIIDEQGKEKPDVHENINTDKPVIEREGTELPTIIQEQGTEIPAMFGEDEEKKPAIIKEQETERPTLIDQEGNEKPAVVEQERTEKPIVQVETTEKPADVDEEGTNKPIITEEENKDKPGIIDEEGVENPAEIEQAHKEQPAVIGQVDTEKPAVDEEDGTTEQGLVDVDVEVTEKPVIIDEYGNEKPVIIDEEHPLESEKEHKEKPAATSEDGTEKPALVHEKDKEQPVTEVEGTVKPAIVSETDKDKPTAIEEQTTGKPTIIEREGTEYPVKIGDEDTEKPSLIDEENKDKPDIVEKEGTEKPAVIEIEKTEKPAVDDEGTEKPEITEGDVTKKPDSEMEDSDKPAVLETENTDKPAVAEEQGTEKPSIIDEEGLTMPPVVDKEDSEKLAVTETESTDKPVPVKDEGTEKPDMFDEEGTKKPIAIEMEDGEKPAVIETESTDKPADVKEEGTEKPSIIDMDGTNIPPIVEEVEKEKPAINEEEGTQKPDSLDKEEGTEVPATIDEEGTEKPGAMVDDGEVKPTIDQEDLKKPAIIEEEGMEKPVVAPEEGKDKPAIIDEDLTEKPAVSEKEGTKDPDLTDEEEGSGTELPEIYSTKPVKEVTENLEQPTESNINELEKVTKNPIYESQTTPVEDVHAYYTQSNTEEPMDVSTPYQEIVPSEIPEIKVPEPQDSDIKVPAILDDSSTPKITESLTNQEMITKTPLSPTISEEAMTAVPEKEKEPITVSTVTEQNVQATSPKFDTTGIIEEGSTIGQDMTIDEAAFSTKAPELYETTELIEKATKPTESESIGGQEEIFTDTPELGSLTTKVPEVGPMIIKPQEDLESENPELPAVTTSKTEEESITKIYEEDKIKPVPQSQITDGTKTQTIVPDYESTTTLPEQSETPDQISEIPVITDKQKYDSPEPHDTEPEKMATKLPVDINEEEIKPGQPEVVRPDKEVTITETPVYSVTEPVRRFTEIEDSFVTGLEEIGTGYPEEATEHRLPSATDKTDEGVETSTASSEKPMLVDVESPELPVQIPETEKPVDGLQEQSTQAPETENEKPTFELPATEIPISVVTESQEISHDKDITSFEEKPSSSPDLLDQIHKGTIPPEGYTKEQEADTVIPHYHVTMTEEHSKATESIKEVTEVPYTSTKLEESEVTDTQAVTTEVPRTSVRDGEAETKIPELMYTETYDQGMKEQSITEIQKSSTELPTPSDDVQTEQPDVHVTSEIPQSLVTEHQEDFVKTTFSSIPKEGAPHEPELLTTQFQESTKVPDIYVPGQEEIRTETPVHITESVETGIHETEQEIIGQQDKVTKVPEEAVTEKQDTLTTLRETPTLTEEVTNKPEADTKLPEVTTVKQFEDLSKSTEQTSVQAEFSETTPYLIELEEHTHKIAGDITTVSPFEEDHTYKTVEDISTLSPSEEDHTDKILEHLSTSSPSYEERTTVLPSTKQEPQVSELTTKKASDEEFESATKEAEITSRPSEESTPEDMSEKVPDSGPVEVTTAVDHKEYSTSAPTQISEESTPTVTSDKTPMSESDIAVPTEKETVGTEKPLHPSITHEPATPEEEFTTKTTTVRPEEEILTPVSDDKYAKPEEKPSETSEVPPPSTTSEVPKPGVSDMQPTDEIPAPEEDGHFPPSGTSGYGEPDYVEEDQAFGPGTCRYGGKVYVSAQQIPRDDPCDFCFCFRSDIICLQQSCPPPIHGCHEEPIQGFCCPRYECPVSMATTVNVTTTTTTTTTTLPPHFPTHSYKGAAQRRGCQIKGHTYKVGEVVRSSSGPCLHCTCGGDGQMKCDPKACTPEPMLRQMIAAAVSAKRRR